MAKPQYDLRVADVVETLSAIPLFQGVKPKELKKLANRMQDRSFGEGDAITTQGKSGIGFFVIEHGNATVSIDGKIVRTLGPGEYFGEIALIDSGPRSATIVASTDLRCHGITAWEFRPFVEQHPEVAWPMLETLASRLRDAEQRHAG
jgi:CRP/FNR family transcriptional regulator, cyclic AMP receptor protein